MLKVMDRISFTCAHCGSPIKASREVAGQERACPKCGAAVRVPAPLMDMAPAVRPIQTPIDQTPSYVGITSSAWLLRVIGALTCLGGVASVVKDLLAVANQTGEPRSNGVLTGATIIAGLAALGLGEGLRALRDIARNSFRPLS